LQLFDLLIGPKSLPKIFPIWPDDLKNVFVIRGISNDSADLDSSLEKILSQQQALADQLGKSTLTTIQRKSMLTPRQGNSESLPLLPVLSSCRVIQDGVQLIQTSHFLQHPPEPQVPLMSEDGQLILFADESRPSSVFNSRHSSSQLSLSHVSSPRHSVDFTCYQGPAAIVQFEMNTRDDIVHLCGGDDYIPVHPSIGALEICLTTKNQKQESDVFLSPYRYFTSESTIFRFKFYQRQKNQHASYIYDDSGYC
jgi:hypothetical protein